MASPSSTHRGAKTDNRLIELLKKHTEDGNLYTPVFKDGKWTTVDRELSGTEKSIKADPTWVIIPGLRITGPRAGVDAFLRSQDFDSNGVAIIDARNYDQVGKDTTTMGPINNVIVETTNRGKRLGDATQSWTQVVAALFAKPTNVSKSAKEDEEYLRGMLDALRRHFSEKVEKKFAPKGISSFDLAARLAKALHTARSKGVVMNVARILDEYNPKPTILKAGAKTTRRTPIPGAPVELVVVKGSSPEDIQQAEHVIRRVSAAFQSERDRIEQIYKELNAPGSGGRLNKSMKSPAGSPAGSRSSSPPQTLRSGESAEAAAQAIMARKQAEDDARALAAYQREQAASAERRRVATSAERRLAAENPPVMGAFGGTTSNASPFAGAASPPQAGRTSPFASVSQLEPES